MYLNGCFSIKHLTIFKTKVKMREEKKEGKGPEDVIVGKKQTKTNLSTAHPQRGDIHITFPDKEYTRG